MPSRYASTRGHQYKLFKKPHVSRTRANFVSERIVNAWNFLPDIVDFSSLPFQALNPQGRFFQISQVFLRCFYDMYFIFCTFSILCVFVCVFSLEGHHKRLS